MPPTLWCLLSALLLALPASRALQLTLLHTNDMHSKFEEVTAKAGACGKGGECLGGFARLAHVLRRHRAPGGRASLYLDAGDIYQGSNWFNVHGAKLVVEFMNLVAPDVVSLGNHEFDQRPEGLIPYVNGLTSPIVAANLDFSKWPALQKIKKSHVLQVDGVKIGVIGYLTKETQQISQPIDVGFMDEVASIKEESERLDKEGVKIIIALGHSGFMIDKKIADEVPLVDVVIGGHTNTFLWNGPPPDLEKPEGPYPTVVVQKSGKKVPVVQAYAYTKYLGRLNVTFDDKGDLTHFEGQPIFMSHDVPQDPEVLKALEKYRPAVEALDKTVVGQTKVILEADGNKCRFRECNFGNMLADAYVHYVAQWNPTQFWTGTPIGIINGGGIRNSIDATEQGGNITQGQLLAAQPFGNQIVRATYYGRDLLETIELGVRGNGETSNGEFLQFSGIHTVYDMSKPPMQRVVSALARCRECLVPTYEPIVPDNVYHIVTTSFLMDGGDGHKALRDKHLTKQAEDMSDLDVTVDYLKHHSPIFAEEQERIRFTPKTSGSSRFLSWNLGLVPVVLVVKLYSYILTS